MPENPYSNTDSAPALQGQVSSPVSNPLQSEWQPALLALARQQRSMAILVFVFAQIALFAYFALALYSSVLTGSAPSPANFLVSFMALTFLPTVAGVFLFRGSQFNRDWALGKATANQALESNRLFFKVGSIVAVTYMFFFCVLGLALIGVIPSIF